MTAPSPRLEYLLQQYAANACTKAELLELLQAVNLSKNNRELHTALQALWNQVNETGNVPQIDKEKIFNTIITPAPVVMLQKRVTWLRIAAAACIVVLAAAGIYFWLNSSPKEEVSQQVTQPVNQPASYTRYITLPDGSTVVLHANSSITYSPGFNSNARTLILSGEAYFDIAHDTTKPFTIYTGNVKTTVLGTAFSIKAYPGEGEISVAVTRGKVQVADDKKILAVLSQNQQVVYNVRQSTATQQLVNATELVTGWTKQDMVFEEVSFESIINILNNRYGVRIEFNNPALKPCLIKASFSGTERLEKVLEVLTTIRGSTYTRKSGNSYVIDGSGCG